jgi:hypothetical protein
MLSRRWFMGHAIALLAISMFTAQAAAERRAFHVTGHLDVFAEPEFGPYATTEFDLLFVYENQVDHPPLVDENDLPPATVHAVEATGLTGPPFPQYSQGGSTYLFKTYPIQDYQLPDPLASDDPVWTPDPAGYSGISFMRAYKPGLDLLEPEEVVFARSRRSQSSGRPTSAFGMGVHDATPETPNLPLDGVSILDHLRVPAVDSFTGASGHAARFTLFFANADTLFSGNDLPLSLAMTPEGLEPNAPWGFGMWEGTDASSVAPGQYMEIADALFGDADFDGDVDEDDEAIFFANLDNDRDGLADIGGAAVYDVDVIPDLLETEGVDETQLTGFATWLLGDFNLDGFVTDADGVYFVPTLPGDGNGDGVVDGLDYLLWAAAYGDPPLDPPGSPGNGDYNDDGVVDGLDYLVWAGNYGSQAASAVPEPGAFVLMSLAVVGLMTGRRGPRRAGV